MTIKIYDALPEYRIFNVLSGSRRSLPGGSLPRVTRPIRFLADLGRMVKMFARQSRVHVAIIAYSGVSGEWIVRAALHAGIVAAMYEERGVVKSLIMEGVDGVERLNRVKGLGGIRDELVGALLILAALLCPRRSIHAAVATLRGIRDYTGVSRHAAAAKVSIGDQTRWVCAFTPCTFNPETGAVQEASRRAFYKSGAIMTIYALDTQLYPVFLANISALYIVMKHSLEPYSTRGEPGLVRYRRTLWGNRSTPDVVEALLEKAAKGSDIDAVHEAAATLGSMAEKQLLEELHNIICGS